MKIRRVPLLALAVSLILASSYGRQEERTPTPIIVGDGSIHIKLVRAPFFAGQWDTHNKMQYRTTNKMLGLARVYLVGAVKRGDWSDPVKIEPIANLSYRGGQLIFTIATSGRDERITVADDRNYQGLAVRSKMGLAENYKPIDKLGTELVSKTETWRIKRIEVRPQRGLPIRILDEKYLAATCRAKFRGGCGIWIDVFNGAHTSRDMEPCDLRGTPQQSK